MNIDTGGIYTRENYEKLKEIHKNINDRRISETKRHNDWFEDDVIEIHEDDLTDEELKSKQVDLNSNTKAAGHARYFRNMRKFVEFKNGKKNGIH